MVGYGKTVNISVGDLMEFIYKNKKRFGDKISVLCDLMECNGIELDDSQTELLIHRLLMDEIPQYYYTEGLLDFDKLSKDPDVLVDLVNDYYL